MLHGKEDLRIERVPVPEVGPRDILVKVWAALTCGTDLKVYKRGYHARMIVPPAVFGHELAGTIEEVHPSVSGWEAGDRVVAANSAPCGACFYCGNRQENLCDDLLFLNGAYAESIVIPARIVARNLLRLDDRTRFVDAALTEPFACVVQGVNDLALRGGERVLVMGSGPIGLLFVALCQHLGCDVTLIGRGENRLAAASRLGAKTLVASDTLKPEGRTFDVVIEAVGKPETWEEATRWVRKGGVVNFFGGCPSGTYARLDTGLVHYSSLKLLASFHHTPSSIRQALQYIEQGVISARDFVDGECPLSELPSLFKSMAHGNRAVKTRIVVDS